MKKDKFIDFKSEKEYNDYMSKVDTKIKAGESLNKEEIDNFCAALPYEEKKKHSFCDNDRFDYLYLHKLDNGATRPKLSTEQNRDFDQFISDWQTFLESDSYSDNKERAIKEEFRYENKNLIRDFKKIPESSSKEHDFKEKQLEIIAYNKYIFQKGLDIFPEHTFPIIYKINGREFYLDEHILFHSLTRHYGEIVKQTSVQKSFFSEDVLVEEIYNLLSKLFELLIERNITIENKYCISIEYKSKPYRIYTKKVHSKRFRINSFFPIEDPVKVKELEDDYQKMHLDSEIFYYNKK